MKVSNHESFVPDPTLWILNAIVNPWTEQEHNGLHHNKGESMQTSASDEPGRPLTQIAPGRARRGIRGGQSPTGKNT